MAGDIPGVPLQGGERFDRFLLIEQLASAARRSRTCAPFGGEIGGPVSIQ